MGDSMMGNKNKIQIIGDSVLALFIIIGIIFVFNNKLSKDSNKELIELELENQKLEKLKQYLKENYEQFVMDGSTTQVLQDE